ncbi:hypothetical protein [Nodularia sp. NIES-3585]|uniref:hypothetical protein n=1 Tax=Nodularia sp. NIES-3585 TaxID=1973477 RepID=UPI000B5CB0BE|nr:hypothetical protein [Nodularia sp. NIES-3585]GAX34640.1 hypothetical protein NIES3585_06410 [Nodularia sp. NIES-3585]
MKFNKKVAIALVAVSASVFGFSSVASAGEGGVAGAVAVTLGPDGLVTEVAAAAAVGKNDAAATATGNSGLVSASALGSAGVIELVSDNGLETFGGDSLVYSEVRLSGSADPSLEHTQENSINSYVDTPLGSFGTGEAALP